MRAHEYARDRQPPARAGVLAACERPADPVRGLLERHRLLCERAVDPLEIAVGLEADGLTDRSAARFRHRDVFSLAEELYARAPGDGGAGGERPRGPEASPPSAAGAVLTRGSAAWLLPGVLCTATALLLTGWEGGPGARVVLAVSAAVALAVSLAYVLRGAALSPLALCAGVVLLGYALYGDALLGAALAGGPDRAPAPAPWCVPVALAWATALALGCARWFARRARERLAESLSLAAFAAAVRPLLARAVLLFAVAVAAMWLAAHRLAGHGAGDGTRGAAVTALALLLFVALLLSAHGFRRAAGRVLAAAAALELLALASVFAGRLPRVAPLGRPVELLASELGEAAVPAVLCLAAAGAALVPAMRLLAGASAHRRAWPGQVR